MVTLPTVLFLAFVPLTTAFGGKSLCDDIDRYIPASICNCIPHSDGADVKCSTEVLGTCVTSFACRAFRHRRSHVDGTFGCDCSGASCLISNADMRCLPISTDHIIFSPTAVDVTLEAEL